MCLNNKTINFIWRYYEKKSCCYISNHRYPVKLTDGIYKGFAPKPAGWFHIVLNINGTSTEQAIRIYHDGTKAGQDTELEEDTQKEGNGRIVIGRRFSDLDDKYASVAVDELLFFNEALSEEEIVMLAKYMN